MERKDIEPRMIAKLSEVEGLSDLIKTNWQEQQERKAKAFEWLEQMKEAKENLDALQEEKAASHADLWGKIDDLLLSKGLINEYEKKNGAMVYSIENDQILLIGEREEQEEGESVGDKLKGLLSKLKGVKVEVEEKVTH